MVDFLILDDNSPQNSENKNIPRDILA